MFLFWMIFFKSIFGVFSCKYIYKGGNLIIKINLLKIYTFVRSDLDECYHFLLFLDPEEIFYR